MEHGIPASGVVTGEDEVKTQDGAELFGGTAGMVLDPCYHQSCDRVDALDREVMQQNVGALKFVLGFLAREPATLLESASE